MIIILAAGSPSLNTKLVAVRFKSHPSKSERLCFNSERDVIWAMLSFVLSEGAVAIGLVCGCGSDNCAKGGWGCADDGGEMTGSWAAVFDAITWSSETCQSSARAGSSSNASSQPISTCQESASISSFFVVSWIVNAISIWQVSFAYVT